MRSRTEVAVAAVGGKIYVVGGFGRIDGNYSRNLASNEAYDPATDRWERRAQLPTARSIELLPGVAITAMRRRTRSAMSDGRRRIGPPASGIRPSHSGLRCF